MATKPAKRQNGKTQVEEVLSGASEKILKQITELYENGLAGSAPGAIGLKGIAESPQLRMQMRKPRRKVSIMIVGNHSAGKSSFINWYINESIQKTGVAIETRGFTFVTSGKKRETLTGDATVRFFDYLEDFKKFEGIIPNLFTEISTSKEKNFSTVDLIDTPGLVDGDMQYPFDVQEAILWMAEHVDLVLVFFDPIGQATCKRCMNVVEALNQGPHLEKVHYFMSKADAVDKEHDRQRVLIQITQNLATRIRNSHAFNLPTFYLPRDDDCPIPNAIEEVCKEIDKSINMTVQKNLRVLKQDCESVIAQIDKVKVEDREKKAQNMKTRLQGTLLYLLAFGALLCLLSIFATHLMPSVCDRVHGAKEGLCLAKPAQLMLALAPLVAAHFNVFVGLALVAFAALFVMAKLTWKTQPVFSKKDLKQLDVYKQTVEAIHAQEKVLYEEYFKSLSHMDR